MSLNFLRIFEEKINKYYKIFINYIMKTEKNNNKHKRKTSKKKYKLKEKEIKK